MESEPSNNAADESCLSASKLVTKERPEKGVYSVKINTKNKWTEATAKVLSLFAQHPELSSVQNHRQYSNKVVASNLGREVSSSQGDKISNDIPISAPEAKIDNGMDSSKQAFYRGNQPRNTFRSLGGPMSLNTNFGNQSMRSSQFNNVGYQQNRVLHGNSYQPSMPSDSILTSRLYIPSSHNQNSLATTAHSGAQNMPDKILDVMMFPSGSPGGSAEASYNMNLDSRLPRGNINKNFQNNNPSSYNTNVNANFRNQNYGVGRDIYDGNFSGRQFPHQFNSNSPFQLQQLQHQQLRQDHGQQHKKHEDRVFATYWNTLFNLGWRKLQINKMLFSQPYFQSIYRSQSHAYVTPSAVPFWFTESAGNLTFGKHYFLDESHVMDFIDRHNNNMHYSRGHEEVKSVVQESYNAESKVTPRDSNPSDLIKQKGVVAPESETRANNSVSPADVTAGETGIVRSLEGDSEGGEQASTIQDGTDILNPKRTVGNHIGAVPPERTGDCENNTVTGGDEGNQSSEKSDKGTADSDNLDSQARVCGEDDAGGEITVEASRGQVEETNNMNVESESYIEEIVGAGTGAVNEKEGGINQIESSSDPMDVAAEEKLDEIVKFVSSSLESAKYGVAGAPYRVNSVSDRVPIMTYTGRADGSGHSKYPKYSLPYNATRTVPSYLPGNHNFVPGRSTQSMFPVNNGVAGSGTYGAAGVFGGLTNDDKVRVGSSVIYSFNGLSAPLLASSTTQSSALHGVGANVAHAGVSAWGYSGPMDASSRSGSLPSLPRIGERESMDSVDSFGRSTKSLRNGNSIAMDARRSQPPIHNSNSMNELDVKIRNVYDHADEDQADGYARTGSSLNFGSGNSEFTSGSKRRIPRRSHNTKRKHAKGNDGTVDDDGEASLSMDEKMSETESISSSNAASLNLTRHRSGGAADKRGVEQRPAGAENSTLPEPTPSVQGTVELSDARVAQREAWRNDGFVFKPGAGSYVGRRLRRIFPRFGPVDGAVVCYLPGRGRRVALYGVEHDDGDCEDLTLDEVLEAVDAYVQCQLPPGYLNNRPTPALPAGPMDRSSSVGGGTLGPSTRAPAGSTPSVPLRMSNRVNARIDTVNTRVGSLPSIHMNVNEEGPIATTAPPSLGDDFGCDNRLGTRANTNDADSAPAGPNNNYATKRLKTNTSVEDLAGVKFEFDPMAVDRMDQTGSEVLLDVNGDHAEGFKQGGDVEVNRPIYQLSDVDGGNGRNVMTNESVATRSSADHHFLRGPDTDDSTNGEGDLFSEFSKMADESFQQMDSNGFKSLCHEILLSYQNALRKVKENCRNEVLAELEKQRLLAVTMNRDSYDRGAGLSVVIEDSKWSGRALNESKQLDQIEKPLSERMQTPLEGEVMGLEQGTFPESLKGGQGGISDKPSDITGSLGVESIKGVTTSSQSPSSTTDFESAYQLWLEFMDLVHQCRPEKKLTGDKRDVIEIERNIDYPVKTTVKIFKSRSSVEQLSNCLKVIFKHAEFVDIRTTSRKICPPPDFDTSSFPSMNTPANSASSTSAPAVSQSAHPTRTNNRNTLAGCSTSTKNLVSPPGRAASHARHQNQQQQQVHHPGTRTVYVVDNAEDAGGLLRQWLNDFLSALKTYSIGIDVLIGRKTTVSFRCFTTGSGVYLPNRLVYADKEDSSVNLEAICPATGSSNTRGASQQDKLTERQRNEVYELYRTVGKVMNQMLRERVPIPEGFASPLLIYYLRCGERGIDQSEFFASEIKKFILEFDQDYLGALNSMTGDESYKRYQLCEFVRNCIYKPRLGPLQAMKSGFDIIPLRYHLQIFTWNNFERLFVGKEHMTSDEVAASVRFTEEDAVMAFQSIFMEVVYMMNPNDLRNLVRFCTGAPYLASDSTLLISMRLVTSDVSNRDDKLDHEASKLGNIDVDKNSTGSNSKKSSVKSHSAAVAKTKSSIRLPLATAFSCTSQIFVPYSPVFSNPENMLSNLRNSFRWGDESEFDDSSVTPSSSLSTTVPMASESHEESTTAPSAVANTGPLFLDPSFSEGVAERLQGTTDTSGTPTQPLTTT